MAEERFISSELKIGDYLSIISYKFYFFYKLFFANHHLILC